MFPVSREGRKRDGEGRAGVYIVLLGEGKGGRGWDDPGT